MSGEIGTPHFSEPTVTVEDGRRIVRQSIVGSDGVPFVLEHDSPDVLRHYYRPAEAGKDVLLFHGAFRRGDESEPFEGSVRWRWAHRPRIEATGTRPLTPAVMQRFDASDASSVWADPARLVVELTDGRLPSQPVEAKPLAQVGPHNVQTLHVEQQLGDGRDLERVTFLVPNGWQASDGFRVCDPDDLMSTWYGRLTASGGGWSVTIDRTREMGSDAWQELATNGASRFTHIGCLTRTDGTTFSGNQAFHVLDRIRLALNLALGRRTTCALPVGWRGEAPVWGRWRSAPVDSPQPVSHWLDEPVAAQQVSRVVGLVLDFTTDAVAYETPRTAMAYYVAANIDIDVELSVSVPVSGLQLLTYYEFVTRGTYSRTQWEKLDLSTEEQLRRLLTDAQVDLAVPPHFAHLADVQTRLARDAPLRDALGVVLKMRNVVTHPTRNTPASFSVYEWAEAGMHARYWLCLALLHLISYDGEIAAIMEATPRWIGQRRLPPWRLPHP